MIGLRLHWIPAILLCLSGPRLCASASGMEVEAEARTGLECPDKVNPGVSERGGDLAYAFTGQLKLSGGPLKRLHAKLETGAEALFFSKYSDNNSQTYYIKGRTRLGRTALELEYEHIPDRLYFPSESGDAKYARDALRVELSRRMQEDWQASFGCERRRENFVEIYDERDNSTTILELQVEYGNNRLLKPSVTLGWRDRKATDQNYDYRSREIEFSFSSELTPLFGLGFNYYVDERTYLTPEVMESNYHRIDARSGFAAELRIPIKGPLGGILGYERTEQDSSREEEERNYRVNSFSAMLRLVF